MHQILSKGTGIVFALMFAIQAFGHNPQVSTLAINKVSSGNWNLMLRAPLLSFQLALQHQFPKTNVNALTPEEFKELITTHLQKSIMIIANDASELTIDSISIALGHEVFVMGKLNAVEPFSSISSQVFASLNDHFIILSIVQDGQEMMKTVLNKENAFAARINENEAPALVKPADKGYGQVALYGFLILLVIALFYILLSGTAPEKR